MRHACDIIEIFIAKANGDTTGSKQNFIACLRNATADHAMLTDRQCSLLESHISHVLIAEMSKLRTPLASQRRAMEIANWIHGAYVANRT